MLAIESALSIQMVSYKISQLIDQNKAKLKIIM